MPDIGKKIVKRYLQEYSKSPNVSILKMEDSWDGLDVTFIANGNESKLSIHYKELFVLACKDIASLKKTKWHT